MKMIRYAAIAISLLSLAACSNWTTIDKSPTPAAIVAAPPVTKVPLAIDAVSVTLNGQATGASPAFVQNFAAAMRETGLFTPVLEPSMAHQATADSLHMTVAAAETLDTHQGGNMGKAFFVGLTLFLLEPALPLSVEKGQKIQVSVSLPNGTVHRYEAETHAVENFHLFANPVLAGTELDSKVGALNMQAIVARLREDVALLGELKR